MMMVGNNAFTRGAHVEPGDGLPHKRLCEIEISGSQGRRPVDQKGNVYRVNALGIVCRLRARSWRG